MAALRPDVDIRLVQRGRLRAGLDGLAVIDERADRQARGERRDAADVIRMEVRDHHVVDAREAGLLRGGLDASGVAAVEAGPPRVDEHRLAGRQREEGRLAALDVDEVDAEWSVHLRGKRGGQQKARERERREDPAHGASV